MRRLGNPPSGIDNDLESCDFVLVRQVLEQAEKALRIAQPGYCLNGRTDLEGSTTRGLRSAVDRLTRASAFKPILKQRESKDDRFSPRHSAPLHPPAAAGKSVHAADRQACKVRYQNLVPDP